MSFAKELQEKKKLLKKGGAGASQKRVDNTINIERKGSQLSIYFDADDMGYLTKLKYKYPNVARSKILKYALKCMAEVEDSGKLNEMQIMGYEK